MSERQFEDLPGKREATPLLVGLTGPSGSGKTFSALRLATGIQRVSGGDIFGIDTEARRMLHYADNFKFRHLEFKSPFGPLDYLAAIEHCYKKGGRIIIVDSTSHEHEGPGGVLEMHETEIDRLSRGKTNRDAYNFLAWQKPKSERRRLINTLLQMPINFVFCFRAKEKTKPKGGGKEGDKPLALGWMPIAGEEFVYEMTANLLLYPACGGVPVWSPTEPGEKQMIKLPRQFEAIFSDRQPLSEDIGEKMAQWAAGGVSAPAAPSARPPEIAALLRADAYIRGQWPQDAAKLDGVYVGSSGQVIALDKIATSKGPAAVKACQRWMMEIEQNWDLSGMSADEECRKAEKPPDDSPPGA